LILHVKKIFDARIQTVMGMKHDIYNFLKDHERKNLCAEKVCEEILAAELKFALTAQQRDDLIRTAADLFMRAALNAKEKELMTINEIKEIEDKITKENDIKKLLEEVKL